MPLNFEETKARIGLLKAKVETSAGKGKLAAIQELMRLKRTICKFPEYKEMKNAKK